MLVYALCHTCRHKHRIEFDPQRGPGAQFNDWMTTHPGHEITYEWPERSGKLDPELGMLDGYLSNANVKLSYASASAVTITLASLATSSTLLVGRQGAAVDNTTNLYLDYLIGGKITTGTTPTAGSIYVVVTSTIDSTNWPDTFTGSDAAITVTTQGIFNSICKFAANISMDSTSTGVAFPFPQVSVGSLFGGTMPPKFTVAVFHNTVSALSSTAGNHVVEIAPVFATVI